jgi:membrane protease YdiL (CAAX protease family)
MIFGGSTIVCLVIFSLFYYQYRSDIFLTILMLTPMFSVILTRVITKEKSALFLKPRFKGSVRWYLAAYLLTPFVAYAGAILFFVLNPDRLDMINSKFAVQAGVTTMPGYYQLIATTIPLAIIINPIMGLISCFGEEFAWRGYLLPKLCEKLSVPKAVLLSGLIWGLWHAPIIATGFNYGTTNILLGIVFMTAFCMVLGIITAFLFFKTKTVWVVVIFHAAVNGIDLWAPANLFMSEDPNLFIGPNLVGAVGGIGFVVVAIVCFISICKDADNIRLQMEEKE